MDLFLRVGLGNAVAATLLAVVAAAVTRLARRPALAHGLWLLVLLKLLTPPVWQVPLPWPQCGPVPQAEGPAALPADTTTATAAPAAPDAPPALPEPVEPTVPAAPRAAPPPAAEVGKAAVCALWLGGALAWWAVAAVRVRGFRRLLGLAGPAAGPVQEQARRLAGQLGLGCCPPVHLVRASVSPLLWALAGRAHLLFPAALWGRLSAEQRDTLLLHELAHLRRRDHWVRRLEVVAVGLYWWLPVAWWARRALQEAEEQCCDAWVVAARPDAAAAYAAALVETVAFLSEPRPAFPFGASGAGQGPLLKRRLTMILHDKPARLPRLGLRAVLAFGAMLLPLLPAPGHGQPPPQTKPDAEKPAAERARDAVKAAELEKARADVKLLQAQLEEQRGRVSQIEGRLKQARERLAKLEGPTRYRIQFRNGTEAVLVPYQTRTVFVPAQTTTTFSSDSVMLGGLKTVINLPADGVKRPSPEQRLAELETKLKAVLKEMEEVRKELGQKKGGAAGPGTKPR
jgi:beta-lactamase regulating signal transducer with metallopeptidase domain